METALIFHQGQELPSFATFPLLETRTGALRSAPTTSRSWSWRARAGPDSSWAAAPGAPSADWGAGLGYDREASRRQPPGDRVRRGVARERAGVTGPVVLLEAPIGPRGDAYAP